MDSDINKHKSGPDSQKLSISNIRTRLDYLPKALQLVWEAASGWALFSTGLLAVQAILPVVLAYLTREVVNAFVLVISNGNQPSAVRAVFTYGGLFGGVILAGAIFSTLQAFVRFVLTDRIQEHITNLIHTKAASLDVQYYESPAYYDKLQRASTDAINQPLAVLDNLNRILQGLITSLGMGGLLLAYAWWLPFALILGALPALWATRRAAQAFQEWRVENTINQRRLTYYSQALINSLAVSEVRLFDLGEHFRQAYINLRHKLRQEQIQLFRSQLAGQTVAGIFGFIAMGLVLVWMAQKVIQGFFSLGDLSLFWMVLNQGQQQVGGLLNGAGEIYRSLFFLEDLFTYLQLPPQVQEPSQPISPLQGLNQSLEVKNITFHYPGSSGTIFSNFSLTIPAGQIVALVGENGAGKSTLLKLLCRFYDPQQGCITWDGFDLRQMSTTDLRRRITVLFQQPVPFHETVADNIRLGDLASNPTQSQVEQAAQAGSADSFIAKLPQGYETVLGFWFGYTELSVGEWQRIALSRAFVRRANLVILDEPTSAMDSWTENEWMGRFRDLVKGETALIITHRFTTAMQADIIHVISGGRIVESGTHAELVALGKRYATSWQAQMRERNG